MISKNGPQSLLVGHTIPALLFKQFVLLAVIGAACFSSFIHCFSQTKLKDAAKKLLTKQQRPNQNDNGVLMVRRDRPNRLRVATSTPRLTPLSPSPSPSPNLLANEKWHRPATRNAEFLWNAWRQFYTSFLCGLLWILSIICLSVKTNEAGIVNLP